MGSYEGATEEQILKIDLKKKIMLFSTGYEYKIDTEALNTKHLFEVIYGERDTRSGSAYGYGSGIFIETIVIDRFKGRTFFTYRNKKTKKFHISQTFKISCLISCLFLPPLYVPFALSPNISILPFFSFPFQIIVSP